MVNIIIKCTKKKIIKSGPSQYDTPPRPAVSGKKQNQILFKLSPLIDEMVFEG